MSTRRITVTVPKPCHQAWEGMSVQEKGRFCQSCQKTVIDFTTMSDEDVVRWFTKQSGSTCGRFRQNQIDRELVATSVARPGWTWKAIAFGLATWLNTKTAEAESVSFSLITEQQLPTPASNQLQVSTTTYTADSILIVKGTVVDAALNELLQSVYVTVKGTPVSTVTDWNGRFQFNLPDSLLVKDPVVQFSFIGYTTYEQKLSTLLATSEIRIKMTHEMYIEDQVVVIAGGAIAYKWYSPRGLYYTARNFFGYTVPNLFSGN